MDKHLIIGYGEIGRALFSIFRPYYKIGYADLGIEFDVPANIEIMHICFPYSENFITYVKEYQEKYRPEYTVIHSTVPVGTSRRLGAIHSPIRGLHPDLESGIRTFVKFIGGIQGSEIADTFRKAGIKISLFDKQETTEAMKLFDTEYYRVCIEFCHRIKKYCDKNDLNFHEVYTLANMSYNEGYRELGYEEFTRPVLQPIMKPIGGHCVMQNKELIEQDEGNI